MQAYGGGWELPGLAGNEVVACGQVLVAREERPEGEAGQEPVHGPVAHEPVVKGRDLRARRAALLLGNFRGQGGRGRGLCAAASRPLREGLCVRASVPGLVCQGLCAAAARRSTSAGCGTLQARGHYGGMRQPRR
jgi:hypothetical protein